MVERPVRQRDPDELEGLWSGHFGDAYIGRNPTSIEERGPFWTRILGQYTSRRVLEVGCANGANLREIARIVPAHNLWGADINRRALDTVRSTVRGVNGSFAVARELPFRDRYFDLVFTVGLLIHQPDNTLPLVMAEIVRCSNRWVMCGEYQADETTDVIYQGMSGVLTKRDYGRLYCELFPNLQLREEVLLTKGEGFDRVTFDVFERVC